MSHRYEPFLIENTDDDMPYEDASITEVRPSSDGWTVTANGWSLHVPSLPIIHFGRTIREPIEPHVGDRLRLYGEFGQPIQGIQISDDVVFYRDHDQRAASRRRWLEDHDAAKRREFSLMSGEMDAEFAALPEFFKRRIERFRDEDDGFRVDSERYEMFCCTEAVKIARALEAETLGSEGGSTADAITAAVKRFHDKPYDEQKAIVADLDSGHSGNTFGGACSLAGAYLRHRAGETVSV